MSVSIVSSLRVALVYGTGVTFSAPVIPLISTDDVYNPENPAQTLTDLLNAISSETLVGTATIDGTVPGITPVFTCPAGQKFIPTSMLVALTAITGSGNAPVINAGFTSPTYNDYIDSSRSATYDLTGGAVFAPGTGFSIGDVLTLSGGSVVSSQHATITIFSGSLVSLALNAAGTVYAPGDTVVLTGGVPVTKAIITVSTVILVSAAVGASGGSGYDGGSPATFNVTVAGGTHSVVATVNVTTDGSGHITTINSVTAAGSYTVLPTLTNNVVTGDDGTHHGTGAELNLVFGINTFTITTNGEYTTQSSSFTQFSSSGSGTGATFNTALFGLHAYTISAAGDYTALPANHVVLTGGTGTGANFDAVWSPTAGLLEAITVAHQVVQIDNFAATAGGSGADYVYMTGGEEFVIDVEFAATYSSYALTFFLFGFTFT